MHWKVESSEYLYKHPPYFIARKDKCTRPDGTPIEAYYVVELPPSVITFGITEENKVLFVQQYRHPVKEISYELPGGFIDDGETPEAAAIRETAEETGYQFSHYTYAGKIAGNPGILNNFTHIFIATGGRKKTNTKFDQQEDITTLLLSFEEVSNLITENKIIQSLHLNACFYGLQHTGKLILL
jgi:ADP-ribose pyrophosphatase